MTFQIKQIIVSIAGESVLAWKMGMLQGREEGTWFCGGEWNVRRKAVHKCHLLLFDWRCHSRRGCCTSEPSLYDRCPNVQFKKKTKTKTTSKTDLPRASDNPVNQKLESQQG